MPVRGRGAVIRVAKLPVVEFGQQPFKRRIVVRVGELQPLLRARQQELLAFRVGGRAGEYGTLHGGPAA